MNWLARLNRSTGNLPVGETAVEVLHWAYSADLSDNVPHRHTYFEVCLVGDWGGGIFTVEGDPLTIGPGDLFIARPGIVHRIQNTGERGMELYWVSFSWPVDPSGVSARKASESETLLRAFSESPVLIRRDDGSLRHAWDALRFAAAGPETLGKTAQLNSMAAAVLLTLAQMGCGEGLPAPPPPNHDDSDRPARLAVRYIHDNLNRPLGVEEVADHVHLSARHLARLFRELTGSSPSEYIETARLTRARHLLAHSDRSITEIAKATGYEDVRYFSRVFRARHGQNPTEFRRSGEWPLRQPRQFGDLV